MSDISDINARVLHDLKKKTIGSISTKIHILIEWAILQVMHESIGLLFMKVKYKFSLVYLLPELLPPICSLCVLYECSVEFQ